MDRDAHEQLAQVILIFDLELAFASAAEKCAENGLDHVLGVHAALQSLTETATGKSDKAIQVSVHELPCRLLVIGAPAIG
jgi:hypothetical protein